VLLRAAILIKFRQTDRQTVVLHNLSKFLIPHQWISGPAERRTPYGVFKSFDVILKTGCIKSSNLHWVTWPGERKVYNIGGLDLNMQDISRISKPDFETDHQSCTNNI
jgi:hypothetical protein